MSATAEVPGPCNHHLVRHPYRTTDTLPCADPGCASGIRGERLHLTPIADLREQAMEVWVRVRRRDLGWTWVRA